MVGRGNNKGFCALSPSFLVRPSVGDCNAACVDSAMMAMRAKERRREGREGGSEGGREERRSCVANLQIHSTEVDEEEEEEEETVARPKFPN